MTIRATYPIVFILLLIAAACTDTPESEPDLDAGTTAAAADTAALRQVYGDIDAQHDQIMRQYRERSSQLPPEVRQRYQEMEQRHGTMRQMHRQMMRGQMRHDGMMHDQAGGMAHMEQLRDQDEQMRAMHEEMAAYLREQGYDEMAGLHEQMTQHYRRALDALPETAP